MPTAYSFRRNSSKVAESCDAILRRNRKRSFKSAAVGKSDGHRITGGRHSISAGILYRDLHRR